MTTGITYFCNDNDGNVYTRYSAGHVTPRYTFAVVSRVPGTVATKHLVTYAARRELAHKAFQAARKYSPWREENKLPQLQAELVPVKAYPGKLKAEPVL